MRLRKKWSDPKLGRGDVRFELWLTNQNDERVFSATYHNAIRRRDVDPLSNRSQRPKNRSVWSGAEAE